MKLKIKLFLLIFLIFTFNITFPQNAIIDTTWNDSSYVDEENTTSIDYTTNPGFLQLQTGENENLAEGRSAYIVYEENLPENFEQPNPFNFVDGDNSTFVEIPSKNSGNDQGGTYIVIDLQAFRRVKRVKLLTLGNNQRLRPRAFTIFAGQDTLALEQVFTEPNNEVISPEANFDPIDARYVQIVLDVLDQTNSTVIVEIQVFGEGFLPSGAFVSSVRELTNSVNFGKFEFDANVPEGTSLSFSVRTGNTPNPSNDTSWSPWSELFTQSGEFFNVFEPRRYIQYKAELATSNLLSPVIDELRILYDTLNVSSQTNSFVSPRFSEILKSNSFTLTLDVGFQPGDYGIDTFLINTPSPSEILNITVNDAAAAYDSRVTAEKITVAFNSTISSASSIKVTLRATPFLGVNPFEMSIVSKNGTYNPQAVNAKYIDGTLAWSVLTTGVPERLILEAGAAPNPFSPNADGVNDKTKIEFFLGNIGEPNNLLPGVTRKISIKIYDLTGRLIKDLFETTTQAFAFIADNGIEWDGRDNNGKRVNPGLYLYQINVDSDNGGEIITKTIVAAY